MFLIVILFLQVKNSMVCALEDHHSTIAGHHCRPTNLRIGCHAYWRKQNNSEIEKNESTITSVFYDSDESISKCTMFYGQEWHVCNIEKNYDGRRRKIIFQSVINKTYYHDLCLPAEPDTHSERQQTFYSEQVDLEVLGSEYYGGVFLDPVMTSVFFLFWIIMLRINYDERTLIYTWLLQPIIRWKDPEQKEQ